jgi:hypothetical protein
MVGVSVDDENSRLTCSTTTTIQNSTTSSKATNKGKNKGKTIYRKFSKNGTSAPPIGKSAFKESL